MRLSPEFSEPIEGTDLAVVRAALSAVEAGDLADNCQALWLGTPPHYWQTWGPNNSREVVGLPLRPTWLSRMGLTGIRAVSHAFEDIIGDHAITVNRQNPYSEQRLHPDSGAEGLVGVVHANNGGGLKFVRKDGSLDQMEFEAGDEVFIDDPTLLHAGVNLSGQARFTLVFAHLNDQGLESFEELTWRMTHPELTY